MAASCLRASRHPGKISRKSSLKVPMVVLNHALATRQNVNKRNKRKIRLLLVDDHPLVREGIRSCLSPHKQLEIVGEAADGREALDKAKELNPDVVLMDINLPGINGLEATRLLRNAVPETKVLILT